MESAAHTEWTQRRAAGFRAAPIPQLVLYGLIGLLFALAAIAWLVTDERMQGMDAGPGTDPGALGFYVTVWVVMMAAMMFPSIWPMVVMYTRVEAGQRKRGQAEATGGTLLFVAGYLVTWTAAGLVAYAIIEIGRAVDLEVLSWDRAGPYVAGAVIVAAALYQLTTLKDACLTKCRSPFLFLLERWRPGRLGALRMGVEHGGWCVGCCWALMAALFALGVMSVGWMAFIAALIAIEKLVPWKTAANRGIAALLLVLGLVVAFAPDDVPGLTLPDSPEAARAMESMGMEPGMEQESAPSGGAMDDQGGMEGGGMRGDGMKGMEGASP
jgi:predicted metal-binding membrane protein